MWRRLADPLSRARKQVTEDLVADPYLKYILLLSAVLVSFWIWHRLPNFATRDERWRVTDPMETLGFFLADPSLDSFREGMAHGRPYGATFYLYGLLALPVFGYAAVTGQLDVFTAIPEAVGTDLYTQWQILPAWVWTGAVLPARILTAALAVGCVYLLYRIGTRLRDRATGRLAALLLALTWGWVFLAHEAGEDVPMLFCLLLVVYLALEYIETGSRRAFLWGCAFGGLAMAFKLSGGVSVVVLGVAHVLRARRCPDPETALAKPRLLLTGGFVGGVVLLVGFPSALVNGPGEFLVRVGRGVVTKSSGFGWLDRPTWWWQLRGTLNGLGWPLSVAALCGVVASLTRLRERSLETDGVVLALTVVGVLYSVTATWGFVRTHHLFPAFPFALLLVAIALDRLAERRARLARVVVVALVVSSGLYTAVGTVGYASQPRDSAASWLDGDAGPNASVETYVYAPQESAVPHRLRIYRPTEGYATWEAKPPLGAWAENVTRRCPDYIALHYHRGVLALAPEGHSEFAAENTDRRTAAVVRTLLAENGTYPYEVAARFGPTPTFLRTGEATDPTWSLLRAGVVPRSIQYGDPQDFGVDQYVVVLEQTGDCETETQ